MVGSYRTGDQGRCVSPLVPVLIITVLLLFLVQTGTAESEDIRIVVYGKEDPVTGGYSYPSDNLTLPSHVSLILTSPSLGFIAVDVPADNETYYTNELLRLPGVSHAERDTPRRTASGTSTIPDDPCYPEQWGLNRTDVSLAWDLLQPKRNISIGLIDTGVARHEDLYGILSAGYDWTDQDSVPEDTDGHGTHLAGIIAAATNNSIGISGIAPVRIIPERIARNGTEILGSYSAVAIHDAVTRGADIILCGYGGNSPSLAEERAIRDAARNGVMIIAPAGNNDSNVAHYPSDYLEVISVGSIARNNGLSYFSNYGIFTELVAPGEDILSTGLNNTYELRTGTSQAAAMVCGIASLIASSHPTLSEEEVRSLLSEGAVDLGRSGRDMYYGYGIVNAGKTAEILLNRRAPLNRQITNNLSGENVPFMKRSEDLAGNGAFQIPLHQGWNFISLPGYLQSGRTLSEFIGTVNTNGHTLWSYHAENGDWRALSPDQTPYPRTGILVYSAGETSIPVVCKIPDDRAFTLPLKPGWNLVGSLTGNTSPVSVTLHPVIDTWVSLLRYNASAQQYDPAIINGAGGIYGKDPALSPYEAYWVYMRDNVTYTGILS